MNIEIIAASPIKKGDLLKKAPNGMVKKYIHRSKYPIGQAISDSRIIKTPDGKEEYWVEVVLIGF